MIKILVDSASDVDLQEAEGAGVYLIPIAVRFGDEEYQDGINLTHREFFEKLVESDVFPKTSQINNGKYAKFIHHKNANHKSQHG